MLRKRLITVLTLNDGVLFRTKEFTPDYRYTLNFVDAWSVDEIIVLDITRDKDKERSIFFSMIEELAARCFVPLTAGGHIRSLEDIKTMLRSGADKVVLNSAAVESPEFITEASRLYGSQCIVVSIDAKLKEDGGYEVFTNCGSTPTGMDPATWASKAEEFGAGEVLVTSIDKDGSLEGYDNRLNRLVSDVVAIPVLGCGGAGKWQDFVDGFEKGGLSAVCTSCIYHFTETSIRSAKKYLHNAGIPVRVSQTGEEFVKNSA